jgi:sporulation protein YlmC with PRC-barrel domain
MQSISEEALMYTNELFGKEVLDSNANQIGKVTDIEVDMLQGTIHHMLVKSSFTKKLVVPLDRINKIGDKIILKVMENEL